MGWGAHRREDEKLPVVVGQFEFVEWTPDKHMRHSRFVALQDTKEAAEVKRERTK
jgi:hypothetical protein